MANKQTFESPDYHIQAKKTMTAPVTLWLILLQLKEGADLGVAVVALPGLELLVVDDKETYCWSLVDGRESAKLVTPRK